MTKRYEGPIFPGLAFMTSNSEFAERRTVAAFAGGERYSVKWDQGGADTEEVFRSSRVVLSETPAPAAPVERRLNAGFHMLPGHWRHPGLCSSCYSPSADARRWSGRGRAGCCLKCAEKAGAFADAPVAKPAKPIAPPVVEHPKPLTCRFINSSDVPCGGPVEQRKMRRFSGVSPVCQAHMLDDERIVTRLMVDGDKLLSEPPPRHARFPGVVPQAVSPGVGWWPFASRLGGSR